MAKPVMSADDAVALLRDGDTLAIDGSGGGVAEPESLLQALNRRFKETGHPRDLTIIHHAGIGGTRGCPPRGMVYLGEEGLCRRVIGGFWGRGPQLCRLANENKIEAYSFPQGVISQLYREIAAGRPGLITHIGLGTFVDPRLGGGKLNSLTQEDLVEVITIAGREWLLYKSIPIDVAWIRGTTADEDGYLSMEQEAAQLNIQAVAQAARNSGGIVVAQVKRLAAAGSVPARSVNVPGHMVDVLVLDEGQWQTYDGEYNPAFSGEVRVPLEGIAAMPFNERKVVARRAAAELCPGMVLNLGVGMPDGVASVAAEEGVADMITLTVEQGGHGGVPAGGNIFGSVSNPRAILDAPNQFDFYDGGGLDLTCLGMAQTDSLGNVNVSRFNGSITGAGGFINISQNAKMVVFCATFTAGGLKEEIRDGKLRIVQEGKYLKFIKQVDEVTFSGEYARKHGQRVIYVTERAVMELKPEGITITEIAPGVDLKKDVLDLMEFQPLVSADLKLMDARLFDPAPLGLAEAFKTRESFELRPRLRERMAGL
ncbi:MAG TPA: CoA-transferase [Chloroflexota bacterium]|nr:CoA-transferase [Chloroflexota bacterium]